MTQGFQRVRNNPINIKTSNKDEEAEVRPNETTQKEEV
jgi:hypothetical protein